MQDERRAERQPRDEWDRDLNAGPRAGQNLGPRPAEGEKNQHTAHDVPEIRRRFAALDIDDLERIPVLRPGERLRQGATYLDLAEPARGEFTASGELEATGEHWYVPKREVPYELWNRLRGVDEPERS